MHVLRWILMLPAAVAAQFAVQALGGALLGAAVSVLGAGIRESPPVDWLHLLIVYFAGALAFIVAGACTAPRRHAAAAVALMLLGIALSLTKHVGLQHLAGNRVGPTNWLHFGLEAGGLVAGAMLIVIAARKGDGVRRG